MNVILFLVSFAMILIGCEFFTNGVEWLGKRFELSEGAIGSILAAVGTAMPETLLPLISILIIGGDAGKKIGIGAILGAPFMLATFALFICGLSVFVFANKRKTKTLHINGKFVRRDLKFFLIAYSLVAIAAFVPIGFAWFKVILGLSLVPIYIAYAVLTLRRKEGIHNTDDPGNLYFQRAVERVKGNSRDNGVSDRVSEKIRKLVYTVEPRTTLILAQVAMGLVAIILGATIFVEQVKLIAEVIGIPSLILALILAPIATELPEKFNSVLWIRDRKDTFAIGNITGAMVFQSTVVATIGILLTEWHISLSDSTQLLEACAIGIALLSGSILYLRCSHKELKVSGLMIGGALYVLFIILVALNL
jgi:cation:H+ antiporter